MPVREEIGNDVGEFLEPAVQQVQVPDVGFDASRSFPEDFLLIGPTLLGRRVAQRLWPAYYEPVWLGQPPTAEPLALELREPLLEQPCGNGLRQVLAREDLSPSVLDRQQVYLRLLLPAAAEEAGFVALRQEDVETQALEPRPLELAIGERVRSSKGARRVRCERLRAVPHCRAEQFNDGRRRIVHGIGSAGDRGAARLRNHVSNARVASTSSRL